jgi:hypothetical protein
MTVIALPTTIERRTAPLTFEPARGPLSAQILYREVNEELVARPGRLAGEELELVCECDRRSCSRAIRLSADDYERVRRFPTRFVLARGHSSLEDERIVELHEGHAVVEKTGPAARLAIRFDPRRHDRADDAA